jgi:hypothetical protein
MMDLGGYSSIVCKKVGTTDADSQATCKGFIQNRYQWIYYRFDWRDGRRREIIDTNSAVIVGGDSVPLPAGIDRIISIRYGSSPRQRYFLDPVDDTFFAETDPTIFERSGDPRYYQEFTEDDGTKSIRFYPIPSVVEQMMIIGKRTLPPLVNDSDMPIIRGIDQVIIAYAESDMLEYHRQYGKAQQKFAEAEKLFADAVALEQQQTNVPRRAKNLTVAGDSLAEMTDAVCARIGQWTPDVGIMVKEFIRRAYVQVYDAYLWPESLAIARVNSDGEQVILPWYLCSVVSVRADTKGAILGAVDLSTYFSITPTIFESISGWPVAYSILTPVAVERLPPLRERLGFQSTDANDNSSIMVRGEGGGDIFMESVMLNGTAPVYTNYTYETPLTIAKGITLGDISVFGAASSLNLDVLFANERQRKRMRLWIQPKSGSVHHCLVLGKRVIQPLVQDEDTPGIRNIANYLIHMAVSESYAKLGNTQGAIDCKAKADASLQSLLDLEVRQNSIGTRVVPWVSAPYSALEDDYFGNWLCDKADFV